MQLNHINIKTGSIPQHSLAPWKKCPTDASFLWSTVRFCCLISQCFSISVSLNLVCWLLLPRTTKINYFPSILMHEIKQDPALQVKPVLTPRYSKGLECSSSWVFFLNIVSSTNRSPWTFGGQYLRPCTYTTGWRRDCERNHFSLRNHIRWSCRSSKIYYWDQQDREDSKIWSSPS